MIVIKDNKFYSNNQEISNELFALMWLDAAEERMVEIDLENLTINNISVKEVA